MPYDKDELEVLADLTRQHRRKIPALTGIRGYAALWVVSFHLLFVATRNAPTSHVPRVFIISSGYLGVDLFFILSGFVLMLTYGRAITSGISILGEFAVGRLWRIAPLNLVVLAAFAAVSPMMHGHWITTEAHSLGNWLLSAFLLQSWVALGRVWNTPAWSLSAEWLAYLSFPIIAFILVRVYSLSLALTAVFLPILLLVTLFLLRGHFDLDQTGSLGLVRCELEIFAGAALCRVCQSLRPDKTAGNLLFVAGLVLLSFAMAGGVADFLAPAAFVLLIAACQSPSPLAAAVFGNRVAHWIGEISFSIYLLHWFLFEVVSGTFDGTSIKDHSMFLVSLGVVPLIVIPIAWLTWRFVEVPGQAVGRAIIRRRRLRAAISSR